MMRTTLARPNDKSPSGLSYFTGTIGLRPGSAGLTMVPETSWFEGEAHVFPNSSAAGGIAEVLQKYSPTGSPWYAIPHLAEGT